MKAAAELCMCVFVHVIESVSIAPMPPAFGSFVTKSVGLCGTAPGQVVQPLSPVAHNADNDVSRTCIQGCCAA